MDADPSIVCDVSSGPHKRMKQLASVMMVVYVFVAVAQTEIAGACTAHLV